MTKLNKKNNRKNKLELLAPAGNSNKMKTALAYGADAVYLGIPDFSLRVRINDFNLNSLKEAIKIAQQQDKKVYVTINIFAHNEHLKKLPTYLKALKNSLPDAFIASDPGVISLIKKHLPQVDIHLSTQANCTNLESARFWSAQGVSRIILGREVTLKEIKEIKKALPKIELEYFIHGAMCMAYSGRCFLSKLMLDRSANLGDCAQPCRWEYSLSKYTIKAPRHEEEFELVSEKHGSYLLNSKDLNLLKYLPELVKAGVTSFKIEGRAKSDYYLAVVCGIYRRALDMIIANKSGDILKKELSRLNKELENKLVHRGYTSGFLLNEKADQNIINAKNECNWEFCGQIIKTEEMERNKKKIIRIYFKVHNTLKAGDSLEIILKNYDIISLKPKYFFIVGNDDKVDKVHGGGGTKTSILEIEKDKLKGLEIFPLAVMRRKK